MSAHHRRLRHASAVVSSLLVTLLFCAQTAAQEQGDRIGVAEEELRPDAIGSGAMPEPAEEIDVDEVVEQVMSGPTGRPSEAAPGVVAVDAVKASMARFAKETEGGIPESYSLTFGDTYDWVRFVTGEWVKGEIKRMREDTIEFDSDELGLQSIDFADVAMLHSPNINTYVFDGRVSATGLAVITAEQVVVQTEEGTRVFPRDNLENIISGGEREKDWWSMLLRFGLTLNRGNTDQLTYDIFFNTKREAEITLLDLSYNGTFGRTDGERNVQRHLGEFDFKVFLSDRWFVAPLFGQLLNDRFQNIRFRATPATGVGVHLIDEPNVKWDFQTGVGYQYLRYLDGAFSTRGNPQHDVFIPLFTYADFDITDDVDFTVSWLTNLVVTEVGNTNHTGRADLAVELTDIIDLNLSFLFLRTEDPAPPADPADPPIEKNDYQLVAGISLELG